MRISAPTVRVDYWPSACGARQREGLLAATKNPDLTPGGFDIFPVPGPKEASYARTVSELLVVIGGRPNYVKAAPIVHAARRAGLSSSLVHVGDEYEDAEVFQSCFEELRLPPPDVSLVGGPGTHAERTARVMLACEPELLRIKPSVVVIVGDLDSTLAWALVAS